MITFQLEWRIKNTIFAPATIGIGWQPLENEEYGDLDSAKSRLSYWNKLSISRLLEFRVVESTLEFHK